MTWICQKMLQAFLSGENLPKEYQQSDYPQSAELSMYQLEF
jgi:hypothetical protein